MFAAKLRFVVDDSACRLYEQPSSSSESPGVHDMGGIRTRASWSALVGAGLAVGSA